MNDFKREYDKLNKAQKLAVDTTEGPLLVIAGPGTGKTQILSARVARILQRTDTPSQNILCLTFTENGAINMRERLTRFIGQDAYNVNISTYHGFGNDLIKRFPEYFTQTNNIEPIDDIERYQIISEIVNELSYFSELKNAKYYLEDLISTIAEIKRALLTSDDLRIMSDQNLSFITEGSKQISEIFSDMARMPGKLDNALPYFNDALTAINSLMAKPTKRTKGILPLAEVFSQSLQLAIGSAEEINKTTPLTLWKNKWLAKDTQNCFCIAGTAESKKLESLADVLDEYQRVLTKRGQYDYEDMIIQSVQSLQQNQDLKFTLQEQYLYIMLDEFQDTNTSQLELIKLLTDNPVNEGKPNVMAVGDDDQAIYSFQGAQYSNMLDFYNLYRDVAVVNLSKNYRSHADVIQVAKNISVQITERIHHKFPGVSKELVASADSLPDKSIIARNDFTSDIAQYDWIASEINKLIRGAVSPKEIAVLAPRHAQLEPLVPYLNALNIPVRYEKRENILDAPVIKQLLAMVRLVLAITNNQRELANSLWPEVLSFEFWGIPTSQIWNLSWKVNSSCDDSFTWSKSITENKNFQRPATLFLTLAAKANNEPLENMLDYLIGTDELPTFEKGLPKIRSPIREFYMGKNVSKENPHLFYETISHLKILREKLRTHQKTQDQTLVLSDLIDYVDLYNNAGQKIINSSPYNQSSNAVQIMTVYKAKGLEFEHVFLPSCSDNVWGETARSGNNKVSLPQNLSPIRYAGASEDERLRLLYVALTRARVGLYLTNYTNDYSGGTSKRLKYLDEREQEDGTFISAVLPQLSQAINSDSRAVPEMKVLQLDWKSRHIEKSALVSLKSLLESRLDNYHLSPTHMNKFIDTRYGGPEAFFFDAILKFPQAPSDASQYGSAVHACLEWVQHQVTSRNELPAIAEVISEFSRQIKLRKLPMPHEELELERGENALTIYMDQRGHIFKPNDVAEHNFYNENVVIGNARMSGKIDRLEIDKKNKRITVVDYKTSKPHAKWISNIDLHKHKQQLYCYKLLVENSRTFAGFVVNEARLEYVHPDGNKNIQVLNLSFDEKEVQRMKRLLSRVWDHVMNLNFPKIDNYAPSLKGVHDFEKFLLSEE